MSTPHRYIVEIEFETRPHKHSYIFTMRSTTKLGRLYDQFVAVLHPDINTDDLAFFYEDGVPFHMNRGEYLGNHLIIVHDNNKVIFLAKIMKRGQRSVSKPTFRKIRKPKQRRRTRTRRRLLQKRSG